MKIIPDKKYPKMYRVQWPNGDTSSTTPNPEKKDGHYGFYNKSRAKEFLRRSDIKDYELNKTYSNPMSRLDVD